MFLKNHDLFRYHRKSVKLIYTVNVQLLRASELDGPKGVAEDVLESNSFDLVWIEHLADQIGGAGMDRSQFGAARDPEISRHIFFGREGQLSNKDDEHNAA